jgi:hypothetical protein
MKAEIIAKVCHEVNKALGLGSLFSKLVFARTGSLTVLA